MKKVAFIGSYDKTDMIMYVAKAIVNMNKKVLVVDSTILQKSRYIIPAIKNLKQYVTTFEKVDVAIGFETPSQIKAYLEKSGETFDYDYMLIDIDTYRGYYYFGIKNENKKYFVTSMDMYNLRKGLQVFKKITETVDVTKVLFSKDMLSEEDNYINFLSKDLKIKWDENVLFLPFETGDQTAIYANQRSGRIQLKGLSTSYVDTIIFMVEEITGEKEGIVKKAVKLIEKN
jgi:hypothetical protein